MKEYLYQLLVGAGIPASHRSAQQGSALPVVTFFQASGSDDITLAGRAGWMRGRVQFDCYAETQLEAQSLARQIRDLFSGYSGGPIWFAALDNENEPPEEVGGDLIGHVRMDFRISWRDEPEA